MAVYDEISAVLEEFDGVHPMISAYCEKQREVMGIRGKVEYYDGDIKKYRNLLLAVKGILELTEETPRRVFSVNLFRDSKYFEKHLEAKVKSFLFTYSDYPDKDTVLEEHLLVKNPGHIYLKGAGKIIINNQELDLRNLSGDIGISTNLLKSDITVNLKGIKGVITIENLTTFEDFNDKDSLSVYLGGFSNTLRRKFLKTIHKQNPDISFYHWGDIDVGGFRIFHHLKDKTEIPFKPYRMDLGTIQKYHDYTKPLTDNDKKELRKIAETDDVFSDVARYMLAYDDCKLEQEAVEL